ncbi:MAG TPA: Fe2+-dependent dioxygenase [Oscillatoriales cyanobacterium M59_W2019_021]|nr:MAG: Fe2+-dependent dioxygenase [Cyanobacteria bacterium J055]HIK32292.1 Fe2+-dependent dioxygenase [Oscillatoriales cyanobacterium M4454_W2019_049]HIK49473.1 Fe2+-dependent dioxygenase [Oscillatoriales cyanobacterium M59_W2019_021]
MIVSIENILAPEELKTLLDRLDPADFIDGKTTAGWHAKTVKNNAQLTAKADYANELRELVKVALWRHPLFQMVARPKQIHSILFSCYEVGMSYGSHVDNALMGDRAFLRSDLSFTLFLNNPADYEGGELVIEDFGGEKSYKLPAGGAIVYPSTTLHRVEPVTQGTRQVVVGWVQSLIRDPAKREILFDLDTARRSIFQKSGKTIEFDLISKSHANLLRRWAES